MLIYAVKRLSVAILVALTVSLLTFSMIYLSGDPAMALAGEAATQADIENIRRVYGYDQPIYVQYFDWLGNALKGNLGQSHYLNSPVSEVIFIRLPVTMILGASALSFGLLLAIPLGVLAAMR
ncbi:ABC transporter permease, partial [Rhodospirillales bacterium]|nr:ABC transporter permease [Rhodospirillales bacterium]